MWTDEIGMEATAGRCGCPPQTLRTSRVVEVVGNQVVTNDDQEKPAGWHSDLWRKPCWGRSNQPRPHAISLSVGAWKLKFPLRARRTDGCRREGVVNGAKKGHPEDNNSYIL